MSTSPVNRPEPPDASDPRAFLVVPARVWFSREVHPWRETCWVPT